MSEQARVRILSRLHAAAPRSRDQVPQPVRMPVKTYSQAEKIEKLKTLMEAMRTEVHLTRENDWIERLAQVLKERNVKSLIYGLQSPLGDVLRERWETGESDLPELVPYDQEVENFKERLFRIDAGITSAYGAIAETGALILWSSEKEPRLMSLVPPIHIAVLEADKIHSTLSEVMQNGNWSSQMPTNAILISGPSKTADIELTLAFGVHGPKELIVLVVEK